jgi:ascorbate-specific PTS system EIIC-type component UlaA
MEKPRIAGLFFWHETVDVYLKSTGGTSVSLIGTSMITLLGSTPVPASSQ